MAAHVVPRPLYFVVFFLLMVLMIATVVFAYMNLGLANPIIMLTIAIAKAALVVLFFMHVKYSGRLIWVVAASGFIWVIFLFAFTVSDYLTRPTPEGWADLSGYGIAAQSPDTGRALTVHHE